MPYVHGYNDYQVTMVSPSGMSQICAGHQYGFLDCAFCDRELFNFPSREFVPGYSCHKCHAVITDIDPPVDEHFLQSVW